MADRSDDQPGCGRPRYDEASTPRTPRAGVAVGRDASDADPADDRVEEIKDRLGRTLPEDGEPPPR